jgi:heptosyltransferase-2/heptosyltransferase-3
LALLRSLAALTPSPAGLPSTVQRVLVIRPDHLGDVLFTTPALTRLSQGFPDAKITALVGPWAKNVLERNPCVDEIVQLNFPGFTRQTKPSLWQPYLLVWRWAQRLRGDYDLALVLRFDHWWGALLAYLARIPLRVGYAVPEVAPFINRALPYLQSQHEVEQNLRLVECALEHGDGRDSASKAELRLIFSVSEQAFAWAADRFGDARPIVIHPGAGAPVKLWEPRRWSQVAEALARETSAPIVLTGSAAELKLCTEIASQMTMPAHVLAGGTDLDQLGAVFSQSRLVLGVDSGPLHLAVAMGARTIHLFGPIDASKFGPWGSTKRHRVLVSDWPCVPCDRLDYPSRELAYHRCVQTISPSVVTEAARQLLR